MPKESFFHSQPKDFHYAVLPVKLLPKTWYQQVKAKVDFISPPEPVLFFGRVMEQAIFHRSLAKAEANVKESADKDCIIKFEVDKFDVVKRIARIYQFDQEDMECESEPLYRSEVSYQVLNCLNEHYQKHIQHENDLLDDASIDLKKPAAVAPKTKRKYEYGVMTTKSASLGGMFQEVVEAGDGLVAAVCCPLTALLFLGALIQSAKQAAEPSIGGYELLRNPWFISEFFGDLNMLSEVNVALKFEVNEHNDVVRFTKLYFYGGSSRPIKPKEISAEQYQLFNEQYHSARNNRFSQLAAAKKADEAAEREEQEQEQENKAYAKQRRDARFH